MMITYKKLHNIIRDIETNNDFPASLLIRSCGEADPERYIGADHCHRVFVSGYKNRKEKKILEVVKKVLTSMNIPNELARDEDRDWLIYVPKNSC